MIFAFLATIIGLGFLALGLWPKTDGERWFDDSQRPRTILWGFAILAFAADAAFFEILPVWGK